MSNEKREALIRELVMAVRMNQNAVDQVDEAAVEYLGINRTDGRCLDIIDQRGRITAGQLATATGITTGAITALLDRLERVGYVRRVKDPEDRRKVPVELTDRGRRQAWKIYGPIAESGRGQLERYSDAELTLIRDFMHEGYEMLTAHATRIREMARRPRPVRDSG